MKDWDEIIALVGTLDLTAYVNFNQITQIVKMHSKKDLTSEPPMP